MKVGLIWVLGLVIGGCATHDHSSHEGGGSVQETPTVQQQEVQHQPAAEAKLPPAQPAPSKKLPPPSKPNPAPQPQQEEPPATDETPDDAATDTEESSATDEEMSGGCGPMEAECVIDNDCIPADPDLIQLWTDYKCTDGMCVLTPITYTFKFEGSADDEDDYLRMWVRTSDGYWEQKDYKLPVVLPLEQLCQPLKKSNYAKGVGESLMYHQLFSVVSLNSSQNVYAWHSLLDKKVWINFTTISFEEAWNVIAASLGGSIGPTVGYIKNLGGNCTVFGLGPNEYFQH